MASKMFKATLGGSRGMLPENFENVGSQIVGNCISGLISNFIILLWLDCFNNKFSRDVRYLSKADAVQIKTRMAS